MYYWWKVYSTLALRAWYHMTPTQYGYILVTVGIVGWFFMKGNPRK